MSELWGALLVLVLCPILGAVPLIAWIARSMTQQQLVKVGTGNISVSAAFYHGGTLVGILAVLSEALKGIVAVLIARTFFGHGSAWELIALFALVIGRYWIGRGAGTTNVVWGFALHDPLASVFIFLFASISFSILRSRTIAKFGVLVMIPIIVAVLHFDDIPKILSAVALAGLMAWIYTQIPDDLNLSPEEAKADSQAVFQLFRGEQTILSLDDDLDAAFVGEKAARLSTVNQWGYPVPKGWVLLPYDDPQPLIDYLQPSELSPLVVRSSAIGEDTEYSSAAGQYDTILNVTTKEGLQKAITQIQASYDSARALKYRSDRGLKSAAMGILIQQQVRGVFSGVAFSRDPMTQELDAVVIEALPGSPTQVVSGRVTPEQYRAFVIDGENHSLIQLEGSGKVPQVLIKQVAYLSRQLETRYHGIPQDIEWCYDGQTLWVLQTRPITTLQPIWTRKIAAEVIPGAICPLTWSINRPLTCRVWGVIFTIVLSERALGLDFDQTATLNFSRAYFNASLLGEIFMRMGLPPESLEFLTRGAKFTKPPIESTLRNVPGLLRLLVRELCLEKDFRRDLRQKFTPALSELAQIPPENLEPKFLLERINFILELLRRATYYSILAPLSAALRQAVWRTKDSEIDNSKAPEVAALRTLTELAINAQGMLREANAAEQVLPKFEPDNIFEELAQTSQGKEILTQFDQFLESYGYLSEVGTDIAVPTWKENPQVIKELFLQLMQGNTPPLSNDHQKQPRKHQGAAQRRINLKAKVSELYSQLLAQLRWSFLALEKQWLQAGLLNLPGDIFFLELEEIQTLIEGRDSNLLDELPQLIAKRQEQFEEDKQFNRVPLLVYGNASFPPLQSPNLDSEQILQGIPASPGKVQGKVKVLRTFEANVDIDKNTILVLPYTDAGWAPLLVRAGGLIADAGGRLSHGAILAREYGIPAVMDVKNATWVLQDGQKVNIDGSSGIVEICNDLRPE